MKNWLFLALIFVALLDASAQRRNYRASSSNSRAQEGQGEWYHTLGYDYGIGIDLTSGTIPFETNGITLAPRYTFPIGSEMSVGAMAPVGLGISQNSNGRISLAYHYTLAATLQVGLSSTHEANVPFGAFMNLGYGSFDRLVRNKDDIGPAFVRKGSNGVFAEVGVRYDYRGNEINLSAGLWRVPVSALDKVDVVSLRLMYDGLLY
jgi:opacity protein-like surface antigen